MTTHDIQYHPRYFRPFPIPSPAILHHCCWPQVFVLEIGAPPHSAIYTAPTRRTVTPVPMVPWMSQWQHAAAVPEPVSAPLSSQPLGMWEMRLESHDLSASTLDEQQRCKVPIKRTSYLSHSTNLECNQGIINAKQYRHLTIQSCCISKLKCLDCTIEISNLGGHTHGRHPALAGMYQTH